MQKIQKMKRSEINKLTKTQLKEELNNVIETLTITKLKNLLFLINGLENNMAAMKVETSISNTYNTNTTSKNAVKKVKDTIIEKVKSIEVVDDSGIEQEHSNGGRTQTLLMKYNDRYWKLVIHSQSYSFQSYIKLYSSQSLDNWTLIKQGNPKNDYGIDLSYRNDYKENVFYSIINDYKFLIVKL